MVCIHECVMGDECLSCEDEIECQLVDLCMSKKRGRKVLVIMSYQTIALFLPLGALQQILLRHPSSR